VTEKFDDIVLLIITSTVKCLLDRLSACCLRNFGYTAHGWTDAVVMVKTEQATVLVSETSYRTWLEQDRFF